jgi:hypothetical protein
VVGGWLFGLVGWLVGWFVGFTVGLLAAMAMAVGWLVGSVPCVVGWFGLVDVFVFECMIAWCVFLVVWLIGWLVDVRA